GERILRSSPEWCIESQKPQHGAKMLVRQPRIEVRDTASAACELEGAVQVYRSQASAEKECVILVREPGVVRSVELLVYEVEIDEPKQSPLAASVTGRTVEMKGQLFERPHRPDESTGPPWIGPSVEKLGEPAVHFAPPLFVAQVVFVNRLLQAQM